MRTSPDAGNDEPLSRPPFGAVALCLLALAALVGVVALRSVPASSEVRIRNNNAFPLQHVDINGQEYGNIGAGKSSQYRTLRVAYRYASVRLFAGTKAMQLAPEDYVGEVPLGSGKFTYVLDIVDADRIVLHVEKDMQ